MTAMAPSTLSREAEPALTYRGLVDEHLWSRLVACMVTDYGLDHSYAERTMNQALAFLVLCASDESDTFSPSEAVDIGWHTFILHTREYDAFCQRIAGAFIHHSPNDSSVDAEKYEMCSADTVAAMRVRGIEVDEEFWLTEGECSGKKCYSCTGSQR